MKKSMKLAVLAMLILSCNNSGNNMAGGPCSYKRTTYPARLIKLQTYDSIRYNAWLELDSGVISSEMDTVFSERLNGGPLYAEQIRKDSIAVGKIYTFLRMEITDGHCTPVVDMIHFEKFK